MKQSTFEFSNPIIDTLSYKINNAFVNNEKLIEMKQSLTVENQKLDQSNNASVRLVIGINIEDEKESIDLKEKPFSLSISVKAMFRWGDEFNESDVNNMLKVNAPSLLLSYARPIISMITASSPIGSYNIPFFNFIE